jgi:hypothetical protein
MSDYLFIAKVDESISYSVSFSKFVTNRRSNNNNVIIFKVGVYMQYQDDIVWRKLDEVEFKGFNNIVLTSDDYQLKVGQIVVVIPVSVETQLRDYLSVLPEPVSRKIGRGYVADRGSIAFIKDNCTYSYQGDFPYQMSCIPKGSFIAFSSLIKGQNEVNKLVFINIHSQP